MMEIPASSFMCIDPGEYIIADLIGIRNSDCVTCDKEQCDQKKDDKRIKHGRFL